MSHPHEMTAGRETPDQPVFDDPRYREFFALFNRQAYYEAHEVLEGPWHEVRPDGPNATFFKGLIQLAGAFCHLKWHFEAPQHRIHGRRLRPAVKLFDLAAANLRAYPSPHLGVDLATTLGLATRYRNAIIAGNFRENPWTTRTAPSLALAV